VLRTIVPALALTACQLIASRAAADLQGDGERLERTWKQRGASVERLPPMFLEHGRVRAVPLDPFANSRAGDCTALVLVGHRGADFVAYPAEALLEARRADEAPRERGEGERVEDEGKLRSGSGALLVARCGPHRSELRRLVVEMRSTRGTLEVMVIRSKDRIAPLDEILPERAVGPLAPRGDPGRPLEPGAIAERLARTERRARGEGAERVARVSSRASTQGDGVVALRLTEGCHRVEVMAEVPTTLPRRATDIDAEARDPESGRLLARDRSDAPDARLDLCLGAPAAVDVAFQGASGAMTVTAAVATWPIPAAIPSRWGARARAGFAAAVRKRRAPVAGGKLVLESLGVQGATLVPLPVEPGRCYLAAVATVRGEPRAMRLSARIGERASRDEVVDRPEGVTAAFCSEEEGSAELEVEVRGTSPWWVLSVWALERTR
jgi:hypothetical protein